MTSSNHLGFVKIHVGPKLPISGITIICNLDIPLLKDFHCYLAFSTIKSTTNRDYL